MSFYKEITTNPKELNQTIGYQPAYDRGVVKCATTKSRNITGGTQTEEIYLYYENYQVKKSLNITKTNYYWKQESKDCCYYRTIKWFYTNHVT